MIVDFWYRRQAKVIFEHFKIQIDTGCQGLSLGISQPSVLDMKDWILLFKDLFLLYTVFQNDLLNQVFIY